MNQPALDFLDVDGRSIAYRLRAGSSPALMFFPGYASDMDGAKASALDRFAAEHGRTLLRFDYSGAGSSGGRFEEGTFALWIEEALALLDTLTDGPMVLVGSSMGAWIALHVALLRSERVQSLVGIAAAPDFTEWGFTAEMKALIADKGRLGEPDPDGRATPHLLTHGFWRSGQERLLLDGEIAIDCPVRLIHGEADREVPLETAFRTLRAVRSADVQLNVIKRAGHRLSEPREIDAILRTVAALLEPAP
jgi:pimeloyl-ACP methyl ester carboxylesterase